MSVLNQLTCPDIVLHAPFDPLPIRFILELTRDATDRHIGYEVFEELSFISDRSADVNRKMEQG